MTGAFLSSDPFLMAMALHGMLHAMNDLASDEDALDLLARLLHDNQKAKDVLLSEHVPRCDNVEEDLISELALRSLEITPRPPGAQLVDENNIVLDADA